MYLRAGLGFTALVKLVHFASATVTDPTILDACPGYNVQNVSSSGANFTADLVLAGKACNVFGEDIEQLKLELTYETKDRIHLKITDPSNARFEVPETVLPRPQADDSVSPDSATIKFNYTESPFSFSIYRTSTEEILFSTASHTLIFEPQYLRVKTNLPPDANLYGLGEHTDSFRLPTHNYTRTFWSRDAYGVPNNTNLYGNHPVYFEHRNTGTHGVFLLNSNGMDVKINDTESTGMTLEYNVIGGVLDFYFLAGSESDPVELARQYAKVVGAPAEVPYWSFGLHQCRFGYHDFVDVAGVISNYSAAQIPLETMWTDIGTRSPHIPLDHANTQVFCADYMYKRRVFTLDPYYFPLDRMREIVDYLHAHDQRYIVMTDPAVAYVSGEDYGAYERGTDADIWMKAANGSSPFLGLVWPGVTVFPDWFNEKTQEYWTNEIKLFYDPDTGLDIDGVWIDMNEPASFCNYPCTDPFAQAEEQDLPPARATLPPDHDTPIFGNAQSRNRKRVDHSHDDVQNPPYAIANAAGTGALSDKTAYTDAIHANGLIEYDTHNIYGTMMSTATREAMLARRPGQRTLIITRSTFAGAGAHVGKWLGDNLSQWYQLRESLSGILGMASVYQVPMVGADICGFGDNTTETLCARWALAGAFYPFMRNHNGDTSISQEFYRWPTVAQAARNALDIRYRLIDYIYTAFHQAHADGTPVLNPLWYKFPKDANTFGIDTQFFFGDSILVSPVVEENVTSVRVYYPEEAFYDFFDLSRTYYQGGATVDLNDVNFTSIPLSIKGGAVLPLREKGAMTTTELRKTDFELVVAPALDGTASGTLYLDDGISLEPASTTTVSFTYQDKKLTVEGSFGHPTDVNVARVRFADVQSKPQNVKLNGNAVEEGKIAFDSERGVLDVSLAIPFTEGFTIEYQ
ncbi:alpha-glucosidase [Trametes elegans]|nr:alpha-glucosidase [Trametes elegans]